MKEELFHTDIEGQLTDYLNNELNGLEKQEVEEWINSSEANRKRYEKIKRDYWYIRWAQKEQSIKTGKAKQALETGMNRRRRLHFSRLWAGIAASITILIVSGIFIFQHKTSKESLLTAEVVIETNRNQAKLILSTGEEIDLATAGNVCREEEGAEVSIDSNGQISYHVRTSRENKKVGYNKIIVPRGGEYFIKLSDGTQIWLNAETELEYPVSFSATKREVRLKGEAYFDVAHNPGKPFIVSSGEYRLQVYGTEFNLNTYHSNNIQAVLVKGSIGFKANDEAREKRLKPNQIGVADETTGEVEIRETDVYPYIAWRNQDMVFIDEPLESILEKVSRWYDVDIRYQHEELRTLRFYGNVKRYDNIEEFLKNLEATSDTRFTIQDKTVTVYKK